MASAKRRVLVTGAATPLGRLVVDQLRKHEGVEFVLGVEGRSPGARALPEGVEIVPLFPDHRPSLARFVEESIDTVVQVGFAPDRVGLRRVREPEADVIGTMCLGTAIAHEDSPVRNWILVSSSARYAADSASPLIHRESHSTALATDSFRASLAEAEGYARDVAERAPHLNVAILRFQDLVGCGLDGSLAGMLRQDPVPSVLGFDPLVQFLHADDALGAIAFALEQELAGDYNVASSGTIHWHRAISHSGHRRLPELPIALGRLEALAARVGIPHIPAADLAVLQFGRIVDTAKLESRGWHAKRDQLDCLKAIE